VGCSQLNTSDFSGQLLAKQPNNPHVLAVSRSQPRGDILSAMADLATSEATPDNV